jgi:septal ring factor EnvC (AmiA/AmiB activator)
MAQPSQLSSGEPAHLQRALGAVLSAVPLLQKLLPLLDGNVLTAVANLLAARPQPPAVVQAKVDLTPIELNLAELQSRNQSLREQVAEQNTSLRRVEDQLEMVKEATDRNTLEQQELFEDLKSFSNKVKIAAVIAMGLIAACFALNLILYLHLQRVLP